MKLPLLILLLYAASPIIAWGGECTLLNVDTGGFGRYSNRTAIQVAAIQVNCAGEYRLTIDGGRYLQGTRQVCDNDSSGRCIGYRLWQDSSAVTEWGSTGEHSDADVYPAKPLVRTGSGFDVTHPVYGTLVNTAETASGSYTDVVRVTLSFPPYGPDDVLQAELLLNLRKDQSCSLDISGLGGFGSRMAAEKDIRGVVLGQISVLCSSGIHYGIGIDSGLYFQNSSRHMSNGTELLAYTLWSDSGMSSVWGDSGLAAIDAGYQETCPGTIVKTTATGAAQRFTVRGDAMIRKRSSGVFSDTVNITIAW